MNSFSALLVRFLHSFVFLLAADVSSDLDFQEAEGEDPTKPLNLSAAVREYQQQQKARKELDGPLLAPCGGFIQDESIIHFPAGPLQGAPEEPGVISKLCCFLLALAPRFFMVL